MVKPASLVGLNHHFDTPPPPASGSVSAWAAVAAAWRATSRRRLVDPKKGVIPEV
jgi:hypothetical protein